LLILLGVVGTLPRDSEQTLLGATLVDHSPVSHAPHVDEKASLEDAISWRFQPWPNHRLPCTENCDTKIAQHCYRLFRVSLGARPRFAAPNT
jgi:hypothetical protein